MTALIIRTIALFVARPGAGRGFPAIDANPPVIAVEIDTQVDPLSL